MLRTIVGIVLIAGCQRAQPAAPQPAPPSVTAPEGRPEPEARSLLGEPLYPPALAPDVLAKRQAEFDRARRAFEADPTSHDAIVWYGRRTAYLGRYREALEIYGDGLAAHPDSPHLLRHRGHRQITLRRFDAAVADLERAAQLMVNAPDQIEIDGLPNDAGVPTGTLYTNVWYHLALAHYLRGDHQRAAEGWRACLAAATTDDMRVAASYWLANALFRGGQTEHAHAVAAAIPDDLTLYENFSYDRLLKLYKGRLDAETLLAGETSHIDDATLGYGLGLWRLVHGKPDAARAQFERVVAGPQWAAFGYIAAEAELAAAGSR